MNIPPYDELVADLIKENLLDEDKTIIRESRNNHDFANFSDILELPGVSQLDFLTHTDNYLPEFSFLDTGFVLSSPENQKINNVKANTQKLDNQNFTEQKKLRRVHQKPKVRKYNKLCPTCQYRIPQISIYCRFCRTRVISNFYYYLIITTATLLSAVILLVILSDKNIR